jgi:hypothetical protein
LKNPFCFHLQIREMPKNAIFRLPGRDFEVAANLCLRASIRTGLRKYNCLTASELADWAYWHRPPISRLGAQWRANASMRSATRRAIAALRRNGQVVVCGRRGRECVYRAANSPRLKIRASTLPTLSLEREHRRIDRR